jgi:hypothetical protein
VWPLADTNNEQDDRTLNMRRINDWTALTGANVEIPQQRNYFCAGSVDAVTEDGKILWVTAPSQNRRLFEKAEFYLHPGGGVAGSTADTSGLAPSTRGVQRQLNGI